MSQVISVLQTLGPLLAKQWNADGSITDYDNARQFKVRRHDVAGLPELHRLLDGLAGDPRACIVRGQPRKAHATSEVVLRRLDVFDDQPSHLFMIDVDKWQGTVEEYIEALPECFHMVSYVLQLSGSMGHPERTGLRAHLWFWLAEPMTCAEAEAWAAKYLPQADHTVHRTVQINYTANPVMAAGVIDPIGERVTFVQGILDDVVHVPADMPMPAEAQRVRNNRAGRKDLVDPAGKPGLIGAFCRAYTPYDLCDLFPEAFQQGSTDERITWQQGGGAAEGICITDSGTHLYNSHATAPTSRAVNLFDFIRLHIFGDQDAGIDSDVLELDPTAAPSYRAMVEYASAMPDVREELCASSAATINDRPPRTDAEARFRVFGAHEFAAGAPPRWHVKGVLPEAELIAIYGISGAGKSFFALDLATAVATGTPWRGRRVSQGRVVYIAAEGAAGFRKRLDAVRTHHGIDLEALDLGVVADCPNLLDGDEVALAAAIEQAGGAALVVIDTLAQSIAGGDENSSTDMGKAISACKLLHQSSGATVCLVAHAGKDASKGLRGWSGLRAAVDAEIEVTRAGETRMARLTKMKDDIDDGTFAFRLKPVDLGVDDDLEPVTSCIVEHLEGQIDLALPSPTGKWQQAVVRALSCAPGGMSRDEVVSRAVFASGEPIKGNRDRRREQAGRALRELLEQFLVVADGDMVLLPQIPQAA